LRRISIIGILVASAAWSQGGHPPSIEAHWGDRSGPYQMSIISDKTEYQVGDPIKISVALKNVSDSPVELHVSNLYTMFTMDVRVPVPDWIPWKPQAALTQQGRGVKFPRDNAVMGVALPPDGQRTFELYPTALYEISTPGKYRITFSCRQPSPAEGAQMVTVVSNEVTIAVLPKSER